MSARCLTPSGTRVGQQVLFRNASGDQRPALITAVLAFGVNLSVFTDGARDGADPDLGAASPGGGRRVRGPVVWLCDVPYDVEAKQAWCRSNDPPAQVAGDPVDWTSMDAYPESACECVCGAAFLSHSKVVVNAKTNRMELRSRRPCPACGRTGELRAARSEPF